MASGKSDVAAAARSVRRQHVSRLCAALVLSGLGCAADRAAALSAAEVQAVFDVLDADGDGAVQRTEYEMHKVEVLFGRDTDGDGRVSIDETRASRAVFDRLDVDGDGQLSGVELVGARELQFSYADRDGDGVLTFDELAALMDELLR